MQTVEIVAEVARYPILLTEFDIIGQLPEFFAISHSRGGLHTIIRWEHTIAPSIVVQLVASLHRPSLEGEHNRDVQNRLFG